MRSGAGAYQPWCELRKTARVEVVMHPVQFSAMDVAKIRTF